MAIERYESYPAGIVYPDGRTETFRDVYLMIRNSPATEPLFVKTRWLGFKPPDATEEEFRHRVGKDTNNGEHMWHQHGIDRAFVQYCEHPPSIWNGNISDEALLTPKEKEIMGIADTGHDMGELVVGDTAQPLKTKKSEKKEFKALFRIANDITTPQEGKFGKIFRVLEPYLRNAPDSLYYSFFRGAYMLTRGDSELFGKMFQAFYTTLVQSESKIAKMFNCEEKVGYHITGLQVWKKSKKLDKDDAYRDSFRGMAFSVHTHNVADLVDKSAVYPAAFVHLVANAETISDVYSTDAMEAATLLHRYQAKNIKPREVEIQELAEKFRAQKEVWEQWRADHVAEIQQWKEEIHTPATYS